MYKSLILAGFLAFFSAQFAVADEIVLKDSHPSRYVIKQGDTLWDIASRFLRDPWRWPDIWHVNPQIANPHLIYPGDQVILTYEDGKPRLQLQRADTQGSLRVVKLSPTVRKTNLKGAIPTIPLDAVQQFLSHPLVVSEAELASAPYVLSTLDEHLVAGAGDKIYVRGLAPSEERQYSIVRPGQTYFDTDDSKKVLGKEAVYVGEAIAQRFGDPSSLEITQSSREILVGDRLIPSALQAADMSFIPRAPDRPLTGKIISVVDGVSRIGQYQIVVINIGREQGADRGHVLAVHQQGRTVTDTIANERGERVQLPDERAGYLMIFRPFERLSYALVMKSERDMRLMDMVKNP